MNIQITEFGDTIDIKKKGIRIDVRAKKDDALTGKAYVTSKEIIWCKGSVHRKNGKRMTWNKFIKHMETL